MADEGGMIVVLSGGRRVRVEPVSVEAMQVAQRQAAPLAARPEPPTREAAAFGGAERLPLTDLKDLEGLETDPHYEEWCAAVTSYRNQLREWSERRVEAQMRVIIGQGVFPLDETGEPLADTAMRESLEMVGLSAPDTSGALRIAYVRHWLLRTQADWLKVMAAVGDQTAVTEEDVAEALAGFRTAPQWVAHRAAGGPAGAAPGGDAGLRTDERRRRVRRRSAAAGGASDALATGEVDRVAAGQGDG